MPIVIPMITQTTIATMKWTYIDVIHAADIAVTVKLTNCDTTLIKQYTLSDGVHYNAASMATIGVNCAQRWLDMKYLDVIVPVFNAPGKAILIVPSISKSVASYDLTGRKIMQLPVGVLVNTAGRSGHMIINVNGNKAEKALPLNQ
jgi:hypothetical protein